MTQDKIISQVRKVGNSQGIIIPTNVIKFTGLKNGDWIEVWFKRRRQNVSNNKQ